LLLMAAEGVSACLLLLLLESRPSPSVPPVRPSPAGAAAVGASRCLLLLLLDCLPSPAAAAAAAGVSTCLLLLLLESHPSTHAPPNTPPAAAPASSAASVMLRQEADPPSTDLPGLLVKLPAAFCTPVRSLKGGTTAGLAAYPRPLLLLTLAPRPP
jgi:hypothetical protein